MFSLLAQPVFAGGGDEEGARWFARVGLLGAFYHSSAAVEIQGQASPGASATVSDNVSITVDAGLQVTENFSAQLMLGIPPKPTITGEGTIASFGELGKVRYGPAILTGLYRF